MDTQTNSHGDPPEFAAWRTELEKLGPSELRARAMESAVPSAQLDLAEDGSNASARVIDLIFAQELEDRAADEAKARSLSTELASLRPSELRHRALNAGVDEERLDRALDSADPVDKTIRLILEVR